MKEILSLVVFLMLTGCSHIYTQKDLKFDSPETISTIESIHTETSIFGPQLLFTNLDSKYLFQIGINGEYPTILRVNPGLHAIGVIYKHYSTYAKGCLWIDAKAGETYVAKYRVDGYNLVFWIEEKLSGKLVGGSCGPEEYNRLKRTKVHKKT